VSQTKGCFVKSSPLTAPSHDVRMVSYNLLADQYASTDHALNNLFAFCPREYMAIDYRKQLIAAELVDYRADILMLQVRNMQLQYSVFLVLLNTQYCCYCSTFVRRESADSDHKCYNIDCYNISHHPQPAHFMRRLFMIKKRCLHMRTGVPVEPHRMCPRSGAHSIAQRPVSMPIPCRRWMPSCMRNTTGR
jgi:mRNA deadenylase 3'-5' endonuclease subunit Ccr4